MREWARVNRSFSQFKSINNQNISNKCITLKRLIFLRIEKCYNHGKWMKSTNKNLKKMIS